MCFSHELCIAIYVTINIKKSTVLSLFSFQSCSSIVKFACSLGMSGQVPIASTLDVSNNVEVYYGFHILILPHYSVVSNVLYLQSFGFLPFCVAKELVYGMLNDVSMDVQCIHIYVGLIISYFYLFKYFLWAF